MAKSKETVKGRLVATDLIPRILCVLLAIIVWMYVIYNSSPNYEKSFGDVNVSITNTAVLTDRDLTMFGDTDAAIEIVILGRRGDITVCTKDDISATVDVSGITAPGKYELPISINVPDTAKVKSYYPKKVTVTVQEIIEKEVPVVVKPSYSTTFIAGDPTPTVSSVSVKGPASVLESVDHVEARPTFSQTVNSSMTASEVTLIACTKSGTQIDSPLIDITPGAVDVDIPIYDERTIPITVDTLHGYLTNTNSTITVSPAEITVRTKVVNGKSLEDIDSFTVATIDETTLVGNYVTLTFDINLPDGIEIIDGTSKAEVAVRHRSTVEKTVSVSNITLANPQKISYTMLTDSIDVTVRASIADSFDIDDKTIYLEGDISEAENGKVPVTVKVTGNYDDAVYAVGRYFVSISTK